MATLSIPVPEWQASQIPDGRVKIEQPITLRLANVLLPDGSTFKDTNLGVAGFFTYRRSATGVTEIWNEDSEEWSPDPGADISALEAAPLIFNADEPFPWETTVVALGQKTASGQVKFDTAVGAPGAEYPRYFFRSYFETAGDDSAKISGLSAATPQIRFLGIGGAFLAGLRTDQAPEQAEWIRLFLNDVSRRQIGMVELRRIGSTARVTLARLDSAGNPTAQVMLVEDGSIVLSCPGRIIIQAPELETGRILYQPNAGGPKQYL